jgi:3-hydroxyacyl-[acyl-carrier-protein] dehydratase
MLIPDFYKIVSFDEIDPNKYMVAVFINEGHDIFKGHFPGNPVMPGVTMMQIIKELTEEITKHTLVMHNISNVKFMALINPYDNPDLKIELDLIPSPADQIKIKGAVSFSNTTALKLNTTYRILQ